jgi:hypothetical protein
MKSDTAVSPSPATVIASGGGGLDAVSLCDNGNPNPALTEAMPHSKTERFR